MSTHSLHASPRHQEMVVDQFTRQSDAFAAARPILDAESLNVLVSACNPTKTDRSLDVACGPGIVACAFAKHVDHATGIDLTPKMLNSAQELAQRNAVRNVQFDLGDVNTLPYGAETFSIVTTRYALHHMEWPERVLTEMARVCESNGRVAVMDLVSPDDAEKGRAFNAMEKKRDPSHIGALTLQQHLTLFDQAGLNPPSVSFHAMRVEVEALLKASFPDDGDKDALRQMIVASLDGDSMGIDVRYEGDKLLFSYPLVLLVSNKP